MDGLLQPDERPGVPDALGDAIAAAVISILPDRPSFVHDLAATLTPAEFDAFCDAHGDGPCPDCHSLV